MNFNLPTYRETQLPGRADAWIQRGDVLMPLVLQYDPRDFMAADKAQARKQRQEALANEVVFGTLERVLRKSLEADPPPDVKLLPEPETLRRAAPPDKKRRR